MKKDSEEETHRELASPCVRVAGAVEGSPSPKIGPKLNSNGSKIPEAQDVVAPKRRRGRPPKPKPAGPDAGPRRRRGAQPGNTNAVKTNAHGREVQEGRALRRRARVFIRGVKDLLVQVNNEIDQELAAQRAAQHDARREARRLARDRRKAAASAPVPKLSAP